VTAPRIRPAAEGDLPVIEQLLTAEGLPHFDFADYLDTFWIAEDDQGVAGCIGMEVYGEAALLRSIVSAPRVRGTGLGADLTNRVVREATARGARRVYLFTMDKAPFFARMGFTEIAFDDFEPSARESTQWRAVNAAPPQVRETLTMMCRAVP
jgi:amino-acid N-acetyltransferase